MANQRASAMGNLNMNMNMNQMNPNLSPVPQKNLNVNQMLDNDHILTKNQTGIPNSSNNMGGTGQNFFKASQNLPRGTISANNIPVNHIK